ncbi:MAG: mitochondrial import inner membrane translocase subunit tim21 [Vezdaea acicularis]|nr:MAG: mitochondrial import inner membrane translocase subunit tim21 [Vezdaea acicularis]
MSKAHQPTLAILIRSYVLPSIHSPSASSHRSKLPALQHLRYATQSRTGTITPPSRRAVTVSNDDGRIKWGELSVREKAARTTQQSFNLLLILGGAIGLGFVVTYLYKDVFSPDSKTNAFNRAVDRVKRDPRCTELLGSSKKIKAFGEPTSNKWARARPLASSAWSDQRGNHHMQMRFNVEGPLNSGVVHVHLVKRVGEGEFNYKQLALDVKGHQRVWLENADVKAEPLGESRKFFGVKWR